MCTILDFFKNLRSVSDCRTKVHFFSGRPPVTVHAISLLNGSPQGPVPDPQLPSRVRAKFRTGFFLKSAPGLFLARAGKAGKIFTFGSFF